MPFKAKFHKREFEYQSPDGDRWNIVYAELENRKYVELERIIEDKSENKTPPVKITIDREMLFDIADELRRIGQTELGLTKDTGGLQAPKIKDYRPSAPSKTVDESVQQSMENYDDSVKPVQSLNVVEQKDWSSFRTGVDINTIGEVGETPEEYKIKTGEIDIPSWQKDAEGRKNVTKPAYNSKGPAGKGFGRVGAKDIV